MRTVDQNVPRAYDLIAPPLAHAPPLIGLFAQIRVEHPARRSWRIFAREKYGSWEGDPARDGTPKWDPLDSGGGGFGASRRYGELRPPFA
jgi:hypothetical protein